MEHDRNEKDYFNRDVSLLLSKRLFLFDMDGTIYKEDKLFDGTLELLEDIRKNQGSYVFITNNSSKSVNDYISKLHSMGIPAETGNFFTSTQATIQYFVKCFPGKRIYCLGTKSFLAELKKAGLSVTNFVQDNVDLILVGFDTELTGQKIRDTCQMLQRDIPYYATNPDLVCPVSFGYIPDCGSICMMLENATKRKPIYIGKPEPTMVNIVREKFAYSKEETVVIGDRLYTDIAAGINAGVTTICVLTGETTAADIKSGYIKPTFTFESIKEIWKAL